jgi:hypothetical protein
MKVSWDYSSQLNGKIKNVPNHQPVDHFGENDGFWTIGLPVDLRCVHVNVLTNP